VPNKPLEDTRIGNIPIFKGTSVTVTFLGCHYSEVFYKDPKVFRPERWES
jgi:cytochrome P450